MSVKSIITLAAENMGRDDLAQAADSLSGEPTGELLSLLRCYNLVENEVALDYVPLKRRERFAGQNGKLYYALFFLAPVAIYHVLDEKGNELAFEEYPEYLFVPGLSNGTAEVVYSYSPAEKGWGDASEFSGKISERLLAFGVASEFCLSRGKFSEAQAWEKRYQDALRAVNASRKRLSMRSRRWA